VVDFKKSKNTIENFANNAIMHNGRKKKVMHELIFLVEEEEFVVTMKKKISKDLEQRGTKRNSVFQ
jgi:hypothetical protein